MERRPEMKGLRIGRVMHLSVGDHDGPRDAVRRCVGQGRVERREECGSSGIAGIGIGADIRLAQLDIHRFELFAHRRERLFGVGLAGADLHALRAVNDQRDNVRKPLPSLFDDQRIGQRNHDDGKCQQPRPGAMRATVLREGEDRQRNAAKSSQLPKRQMRREGDAE